MNLPRWAVFKLSLSPNPVCGFPLLNVLDHILRYVALAQMWACGARAGILTGSDRLNAT
ncbi:hypothetical protein SBC2_73220 (plasmid) [Caballeronia sp. SBC2]|nr:hypothetical protein SBC2_73220 [Caballeronia sp. SBC2]